MNFIIASQNPQPISRLLVDGIAAKSYIEGSPETLSGADAVIIEASAKPFVSPTVADIGIAFDSAKAVITNNMASFCSVADYIDTFARDYKDSRCQAPILVVGAPVDICVGYLYSKHNITAYGLAPKMPNAVKALLSDTKMQSLDAQNINYLAAGVGDAVWLYDIKDKDGKDLYPLFRKAAEGVDLGVLRYELSLYPLKSLKFFEYWHTATSKDADTSELIKQFAEALSSDEGQNQYFVTVNHEYIYGIDQTAVTLPCKVGGGRVSPAKADLPLQCVLASNDYSGALLTAVAALATRSPDKFLRAVKLDPYIASILALDEADAFANKILKSLSAFFGGK